jgi:hypothetical protein
MTNAGDIIRQVETALNDTRNPPTPEEKEILTTILYKVYAGMPESGVSREHFRIRAS